MADEGPLVAVLAAGLGTRFARGAATGKLDADCAGKPLGQRALEAVVAAGLAPGVIVVGPRAPGFALASGWALVTNPHPENGLGGSVALAAAAAMHKHRDLLLLLADMPLISPDYLAALAAQAGVSATRYPSGNAGVPARLPLAALPEILRLAGDRGAARLLAGMDGLTLLDPPAGMLADVDNPTDLAKVAALLRPA
jgi:CTP:molybdopterin cytidylyltransferase MocA